jgi:hypothetical protein
LLAAALPLSAHTYRLLIVKEPSRFAFGIPPNAPPTNRCVRQQQRNEIMQHFLIRVNPLLPVFCASRSQFRRVFTLPIPGHHERFISFHGTVFERDANYIKGFESLASVSRRKLSFLLFGLQ